MMIIWIYSKQAMEEDMATVMEVVAIAIRMEVIVIPDMVTHMTVSRYFFISLFSMIQ